LALGFTNHNALFHPLSADHFVYNSNITIPFPQFLETTAVVASTVQLGPTGLESNLVVMSANNSLYSSPASSSSNVARGLTGQCHALSTSRRNSFDTVIAIANDRAAADSHGDVLSQVSSSAVSDESPHSSPRGYSVSRSRKSKPFDVESQAGSMQEIGLGLHQWPTASRLAAMNMETSHATSHSDATATALAFQAQAQSRKVSLWASWAPYFGL